MTQAKSKDTPTEETIPTDQILKPVLSQRAGIYQARLAQLLTDKDAAYELYRELDSIGGLLYVKGEEFSISYKATGLLISKLFKCMVEFNQKPIYWLWCEDEEYYKPVSDIEMIHLVQKVLLEIEDYICIERSTFQTLIDSQKLLHSVLTGVSSACKPVELLELKNEIYCKDKKTGELRMYKPLNLEFTIYNHETVVVQKPILVGSDFSCSLKDLEKKAPLFYKHIGEMFQYKEEDMLLLLKWLGLTLTPINKGGLTMTLAGSPSAGKGTLVELMKQLVWGATADGSALAGDRFSTESLLGSRMIFWDEFPDNMWSGRSGECIKQFVSGASISVRVMHKGYVEVPGCVHAVFCANHLPMVEENIDSVKRRMLVLEPYRSNYKDKDINRLEKLLGEAEAIRTCLVGFCKIATVELTINKGRLKLTEEQKMSIDDCMASVYSPTDFIDNYLLTDEDGKGGVALSDLRQKYKQKCSDLELNVGNDSYIAGIMSAKGYEKTRFTHLGRKITGYRGVYLKK